MAALVITSVMVAVITVGVSHIAQQRALLWQRLIAQQTLCNTMELIDGWQTAETTDERLQTLPLETWAAEQLPQARLECRLLDPTPGPVRGVLVAVIWQSAPIETAPGDQHPESKSTREKGTGAALETKGTDGMNWAYPTIDDTQSLSAWSDVHNQYVVSKSPRHHAACLRGAMFTTNASSRKAYATTQLCSAWSDVHNQYVVSKKPTPPRELAGWSDVHNQIRRNPTNPPPPRALLGGAMFTTRSRRPTNPHTTSQLCSAWSDVHNQIAPTQPSRTPPRSSAGWSDVHNQMRQLTKAARHLAALLCVERCSQPVRRLEKAHATSQLAAWSDVHNQYVVSKKPTPPRSLSAWSDVHNQYVVSEKPTPPRSLSAWSDVHNQYVVSEKPTPPRSLPAWSGVHNQYVVSKKPTPPRSLSAWSGVSSEFSRQTIEYRPTRTSRGVTMADANFVLEMNMAQPRQARLWPKADGIPDGIASTSAERQLGRRRKGWTLMESLIVLTLAAVVSTTTLSLLVQLSQAHRHLKSQLGLAANRSSTRQPVSTRPALRFDNAIPARSDGKSERLLLVGASDQEVTYEIRAGELLRTGQTVDGQRTQEGFTIPVDSQVRWTIAERDEQQLVTLRLESASANNKANTFATRVIEITARLRPPNSLPATRERASVMIQSTPRAFRLVHEQILPPSIDPHSPPWWP